MRPVLLTVLLLLACCAADLGAEPGRIAFREQARILGEEMTLGELQPFSAGQTVVIPETDVEVQESDTRLVMMPEAVSIGDVVRGLNAIGATPRDLIAIFQAIKAAGALQAELEII